MPTLAMLAAKATMPNSEGDRTREVAMNTRKPISPGARLDTKDQRVPLIAAEARPVAR